MVACEWHEVAIAEKIGAAIPNVDNISLGLFILEDQNCGEGAAKTTRAGFFFAILQNGPIGLRYSGFKLVFNTFHCCCFRQFACLLRLRVLLSRRIHDNGRLIRNGGKANGGLFGDGDKKGFQRLIHLINRDSTGYLASPVSAHSISNNKQTPVLFFGKVNMWCIFVLFALAAYISFSGGY